VLRPCGPKPPYPKLFRPPRVGHTKPHSETRVARRGGDVKVGCVEVVQNNFLRRDGQVVIHV